MPIHMVSPRDYTLRTRTGHVIFYPANEPILTPDSVVAEAMQVNILPTDKFSPDEDRAGVAGSPSITGTLKDALIFDGIDQLVKENDNHNFNAGGQPKLKALNDLTGIRLSGGELTKYWERYREVVATNSPMPSHPQLDLIRELQNLTTRAQLVEFAKDTGYPVDDIKRRATVKEAKEALLQATLNYHPAAAKTDED